MWGLARVAVSSIGPAAVTGFMASTSPSRERSMWSACSPQEASRPSRVAACRQGHPGPGCYGGGRSLLGCLRPDSQTEPPSIVAVLVQLDPRVQAPFVLVGPINGHHMLASSPEGLVAGPASQVGDGEPGGVGHRVTAMPIREGRGPRPPDGRAGPAV